MTRKGVQNQSILTSLMRRVLLYTGRFHISLVFSRSFYCVRFLFLSIFFMGACSQEKKTWSSLAWHNTLAHYNGYFIAREKMKEFEADQLAGYKDNYNRVLDIYPFPPLGSASSANAAMEEVIKKASIPIQRHKNSKWLDDSYLLIGKARFYKEDWENAIQTFKFINTKFKDQDVKHHAVIWLLITYTRMGDISNAKSVIAYLKKETLSKDNLREGALAFAYYYQRKKEYQKMMDYLSMGVQLMPRSRKKGRLAFVLGQLNQKYKHDPEAYSSYKSALRCWPNFELEFYSRLNMAQVVAITEEKQLKKIRKNFKRMTTDLKYEDYLDRVYYEMGLFEIKQNNMPKGLEFLKLSLRKSKGPTGQKPYTYLKLADLHYNPMRNYAWAKNYYDSTLLGLDTADDNYKFVARRQKILAEFVVHYYIIEKEDSLQRLAKMDSTQLFTLIDRKIKEEKEKLTKAEKAAKKEADAVAGGADPFDNSALSNLSGGNNAGNQPAGGAQSGGWYFSNLAAVSNGKLDFKKKWGNRKLEDNWRRSNKESEFDENDANASADSSTKNVVKTDAESKQKSEPGNKKEPILSQADLRKPYLAEIPFSSEMMAASNSKLQVALFEIGKIYDQKLEEPDLAVESLERDVKDYPSYEKVPEALYNLCVIYKRLGKQADYDRCKEILLSKHPGSLFAKLILNPNYLIENKQRNEIISGLYKNVFDQYKANMFIEASNGIASIRTNYPKSDFEDKLAILSALITAKTVDIPTYVAALKKFMADYPKSNLQEFARLCLTNAEKGKSTGTGVPMDSSAVVEGKPKKPEFNESLNTKQYLIILIPSLDIPEAQIQAAFSDFNAKFYPGEGLQVTSLPFGDNKHVMIKVQELPSKIQGMYYAQKVQEAGPFKKEFKNLKPTYLLVTPENLQLLYKSKAISDYAVFYAKNYNLKKELDDDVPTFGK